MGSLLLGAASRVWAADVWIDLRSAADLDEFIPSTRVPFSRQRFVQQLGITARHIWTLDEREVLSATLWGRWETDFARVVLDGADDPRDAEPVDLVLERAHIDLRPTPWMSLRAGRQVVWGGLPAVDVDGGALDLESRLGVFGHIAGGREVRRDVAGLDSQLFDRPGARFTLFDDGEVEPTWLTEGALGWRRGLGSVQASHRLRLRHGDRVGQDTGLTASLDPGSVRLRGQAILNHLMGSTPDRLWLRLEGTLPRPDLRVWLDWRYARPAFDGDSLFNAFDVTPWVEWRLGGEVPIGPSAGVGLEGRQRAFERGADVPWSGGFGPADDVSRGVGLRGHATFLPVLHGRGSVAVDGGAGGLLVDSDGALTWDALPGLVELGLRGRHLYREAEAGWLDRGHLLAARGQGRVRLTSFGVLTVWVDYVTSYRVGQSVRFFALVDFALGPF